MIQRDDLRRLTSAPADAGGGAGEAAVPAREFLWIYREIVMQAADYFPIEYIFNLASIYRNGFPRSAKALRAAIRRRGFRSCNLGAADGCPPVPRISFWIRLCQSASLLDEGSQPYPTLLFEEWLAWPLDKQIDHLVNAWAAMPNSKKTRQVRENLLSCLRRNIDLTAGQKQKANGLYVLGIWNGTGLSELGRIVFTDRQRGWKNDLLTKWKIEEEKLLIPFPCKWDLLWHLERYLDPLEPGIYSLQSDSMQLAVRRGALLGEKPLQEILRIGLGHSPSVELLDMLVENPNIQVTPGYLLEFDQPDTLKKLRQSSSWRRELSQIISPRHVILDLATGYPLLLRLFQSGLISENNFAKVRSLHPSGKKVHSDWSSSDRAYLVYLLLSNEGAQKQPSPPTGLLSRLSEGVDPLLLAAAAHKAETTPKELARPTEDLVENPEPEQPDVALLAAIQSAIDRGDSIDVLYRASGRHIEEQRHLTPLILEQRGDRFYLIAYCHTRKANRTFRLDRLKWVE